MRLRRTNVAADSYADPGDFRCADFRCADFRAPISVRIGRAPAKLCCDGAAL
jgi:hypothetical protein